MNLSEQEKVLIQAAIEASKNAYIPYSHYPVGAALQTSTGEIFTGANVENAVYPLTICAERAAVFSAVSAGQRSFDTLAVVTKDGGTPCGSCRQVLAEFGVELVVLICDLSGVVHQKTTVKDLLPFAFGSDNLENSSKI